MASPVAEALADVAHACGRLGARHFVFGAQAAVLHGFARATDDVDVTVGLPDGVTAADLVRALGDAGFALLVTEPDAFVRVARVLPMRHARTGLRVDVVLAGPGLEERFFARTVERDVDGQRVPVVRPEDLVAMKVLAGRPKDLEDVVGVMAAQRDVFDTRMARETVRLLERALDRRDLMPLLDGALARAGLTPKRPSPKKPKRGKR